MADQSAVAHLNRVPSLDLPDALARSGTAPADFRAARPFAIAVAVGAGLEASLGDALAGFANRTSTSLNTPIHFGFSAGFHWVAFHALSIAAAVLTIGHTGGQLWCPILAASSLALLALSALGSRGLVAGRWPAAIALGLGMLGGGLALIPMAVAAALAVLAIVGFALWGLLVVVLYLVICIVVLFVIGLLLWAWFQGS